MRVQALADPGDVETLLGRSLTADELPRVAGLLVEASATVRGFLRCTPDPVPGDVVVVVSRMVARSLAPSVQSMPVGMSSFSDTAGPFSQNRTFSEGSTSGSPWLTRDDKRILRGYGCRGRVQSFETR